MATQKPSKPNVVLPNNFGGVKTPYTQAQIDNGYQEAVPQVVDGGNINYEKDALFQKLKYLESVADAVNNIPPGKFLVVNSNNQFEYADSTVKSSFGNIGDIEYTSRTDVPNGGAWCDGALYTKAQFPDVYQMLVDGKLQSTTVSKFDSTVSANGSCGFFGLDTANERFKVPMLKDVYLKAGQAPSMFGAESLPNVKGSVGTIGDYNNTAVVTGAFKRDKKTFMLQTQVMLYGFIMQHSMPPAHHQPTKTVQRFNQTTLYIVPTLFFTPAQLRQALHKLKSL